MTAQIVKLHVELSTVNPATARRESPRGCKHWRNCVTTGWRCTHRRQPEHHED